MTVDMLEQLDAFGRRVVAEELGGDGYPASARCIAYALDRIAELEAALSNVAEEVERAHDGTHIFRVREICAKALSR